MEENNDLNKKNEVSKQSNFDYWKPVLFFYAKTTSWIIFPLILGTLAGKYVSKTVGSQVLFFVFLMLGFLVTCWGIYREIKQYKKTLGENENSKISAPSPSETKGQGTDTTL